MKLEFLASQPLVDIKINQMVSINRIATERSRLVKRIPYCRKQNPKATSIEVWLETSS